MPIRSAGALCALACSFAAAVTTASAAEWFVSTAGSDQTGTGTIDRPFRHIGHVLDPAEAIVQPGDTVTLRGPAGNRTYHECDVRLRMPLVLRSYPGETAHIHCDIAVADSVVVQIDPEASGSRLSGLEISGGYYYGIFLQTDWYQGGGEDGRGASDVTIEDTAIHDTGRDAIKITPHADRATIRRCRIWNTGAIYAPGTPAEERNAEGIDNVNGSGMRVEDSHIRDTSTTGLYFKGGAAGVVIERNRIENPGIAGILVGFDTSPEFFDLEANPDYYEAVDAIVRNNIVTGSPYAGIGLYASRNAVVVNNTIIDSAARGHAALYFGVTYQDWEPQALRPANRDATIRNNLIVQHGRPCLAIRWSADLGGLSGLAGAPGTDYNAYSDTTGACRFVDARPGSPLGDGGTLAQWRGHAGADAASLEAALPMTGDGHLLPGNPAIDAGQSLALVVDDIDRQPRSGAYDIGADEIMPDALFADGFE